MRKLRIVTLFLVLVVVIVAVASIIASRQSYGQSTRHHRPGIQCPMVVQEQRRLRPLGYRLSFTDFLTRRGAGYMQWVPVSYTFRNEATGDHRRVHCRGVARGPSRPLPLFVAGGGE